MTRTDHPLTGARAEGLWNKCREQLEPSGGRKFANLYWSDSRTALAAMRAAYDAGRENVSADPHHDPRPWQDCTRDDIREGDLVEARSDDLLRVGVAHHQDDDGDWWTKGDYCITWGDNWPPCRRIPAPTPPAEEVELPDEFGAVITDVEMRSGEQYDRMVYTECFWAYDAASYESKYVATFTLPDGTRARRDGDRFIKVQEEEK